jgi:hypothetical protein
MLVALTAERRRRRSGAKPPGLKIGLAWLLAHLLGPCEYASPTGGRSTNELSTNAPHSRSSLAWTRRHVGLVLGLGSVTPSVFPGAPWRDC